MSQPPGLPQDGTSFFMCLHLGNLDGSVIDFNAEVPTVYSSKPEAYSAAKDDAEDKCAPLGSVVYEIRAIRSYRVVRTVEIEDIRRKARL